MRYPNLFLAGAPKCGTTSLAYYLGQHPGIFAPVVKEPVFFGSDLTITGARRAEQSYLDLYRDWSTERYGLDASPHYFYARNAAQEIAKVSPEAAIVVMVRNPVEAAYSQYFQLRFNGAETLETFEASLAAEPRRTATPEITQFGFSENFLYSRIYAFTENIQKFEQAFGKDRVHVGLMDDLKSDRVAETRRLCRLLGLDDTPVADFDFDIKNAAKRVRLRWLNTLAHYPPGWIGTLTRPLASPETRFRIRQFIGRTNARNTTNPPMSDETRQRLTAQFRPEIEKLAAHLDRDLSHWLEPAASRAAVAEQRRGQRPVVTGDRR